MHIEHYLGEDKMKWIEKKEDMNTLGDFEDYINTGFRKKLLNELNPFKDD